MKFLRFVRCNGKSRPENTQRTEESPALMEISCAATGSKASESCKSKTNRRTDRNLVAGSPWRPSLGAISEDRAVHIVVGKGERMVRSRKDLAEKAPSTAKKHSPIKRRESWHVVVPASIPTFTPTGFLF